MKLQTALNKVGYPTVADDVVGSKTRIVLVKVLEIEEEVNSDRQEGIVCITQQVEELGIPGAFNISNCSDRIKYALFRGI